MDKLDLSERSENPWETQAQKAAQGEQHEKPPTDSHVPAAWGRERGVSHQRKPHVADKSLQNKHCWNSVVKHTVGGEDELLVGTGGWKFFSPPCCWEVKWWKKGSKSNTGRQRHIHRHPLCAGMAQPGVILCWTESSCFGGWEVPWIMNFQSWIELFIRWFCPKGAALCPYFLLDLGGSPDKEEQHLLHYLSSG